jgi:cell division protein FtsB
MEPYVKEQFTKAIAMCGDKPEYENVKDFMQDMIDENIAMKAKETPTHMLKFLHNAAYNQKFSLEFRDCIQNVVFERQIDDQATTFLVRKLRIICDTREEDIKKKDERIHELEELVSELETRLEKMREINDMVQTENDALREQNDTLQKQARREYGPGEQFDDYMKTKQRRENSEKADELAIDDEILNHLSDGKIVLDTSTILQNIRAKKLYGETENKTRLNQRLYALEKNNKIKKVGEKAWQIVRTGHHGEQISEYEHQRWHNNVGWP